MNKKNTLINLGCRLNIYEGEILKNHINNNNIIDVTVINSCAVTAEAEKKVAYEIRKAKRDNPKNKIIVTGCAAQINPKKYDAIEEVDLVLGNKEKLLTNIWENLNFLKRIQVNDILSEKKTIPATIEKFDGKSRAYIVSGSVGIPTTSKSASSFMTTQYPLVGSTSVRVPNQSFETSLY